MPRSIAFALLLTAAAALPARAGDAPSLRGSPESMVRQNRVAKENDYSFLRDGEEVRRLADKGLLVRVAGGEDWRLAKVSFPYTRPDVATFIERLAPQYRDACGERLVVTSLTRPTANQPGNAHELSVHPAGMAVDLRISKKAACRGWLESTLLALESRGLLDVTRESRPPHYHVAVFPDAYRAYVERQGDEAAASRQAAELDEQAASVRAAASAAARASANAWRAASSASASVSSPDGGREDDAAEWSVLAAVAMTAATALAALRLRRAA